MLGQWIFCSINPAFYIEDCRILVETGDASMAYQNRIQPGYIMWWNHLWVIQAIDHKMTKMQALRSQWFPYQMNDFNPEKLKKIEIVRADLDLPVKHSQSSPN